MRPKEWLVKNGHLPPGSEEKRGRISLENIERIKKAVAEGAVIDGYSVSKTEKSTAPVVEKAKVSTEKQVIEPAPYRYPETEFMVVETESGKLRNMREACNNCRCSLVVCWCESPRIVATDGRGSVLVTIKRR